MKKHLKRLAAPLPWHSTKKTAVWITRPRPGPHPIERGIPLLVVVRDMLGYCDTAIEARRIIGNREIMVDGRIVTDPKRPIGFMDVVSIPKTKENFREEAVHLEYLWKSGGWLRQLPRRRPPIAQERIHLLSPKPTKLRTGARRSSRTWTWPSSSRLI